MKPLQRSNRKTYAVARSVTERHERLVLAASTNESFRNELIGIRAPELFRSVQVQVREIDQHAGRQLDGLLA